MDPLDIFVVVSGSFSILATLPLVYLAFQSFREGRELRSIQLELAGLMSEVRDIQHEIHHDQRRAATEMVQTKETVEKVAEAAVRRRRLPRVRVELNPARD
jgi:hypothetical protein